jgi:hypothetical protein
VVSSSDIKDEMIQQYIQEREGEPIADESQFHIDPSRTSCLIDEGCSIVLENDILGYSLEERLLIRLADLKSIQERRYLLDGQLHI